MQEKFGFKILTSQNWQEPDPTVRPFVCIRDGESVPITGDKLTSLFLQPKLSESVPLEVIRLFEVARGALCYGYFFYPMYTLGSEQLYRVHEAALTHKCRTLNAPGREVGFKRMVEWLVRHDAIFRDRRMQWGAMRELRNSASHAQRQSIYDPVTAMSNVRIACELINELFGCEDNS